MSPVIAQTRTDTAKLIVTVVDPSGGVIPNATVTVVGLEGATKAATIAPVKTTDKGLATFDALPPGRYSITGEFPGFELGLLKDIRLKAGDNKHVVDPAAAARCQDSVTVGRDAQQAAADRTSTFGTALTREQIDALSDDPDEMARQLQDMAGPDARASASTASKAAGCRRSRRSSRSTSRAMRSRRRTTSPAASSIDIITQPGIGAAARRRATCGSATARSNGSSPLDADDEGPGRRTATTAATSAARS